jgi:hypothetical protein
MLSTLWRVLTLATVARVGFGGEDVTVREGDKGFDANWHHRDLTIRALTALKDQGWTAGARSAIAWHADMIDSYLYNPLWWVQGVPDGGMHRFKVAVATEEHLKNLHFDDLTSLDQIETMWRRYLAGTLAGLTWASEQPGDDGVAAAHNIIGVSLHAIQDFFAHSNWVDEPARRGTTWFDRSSLSQPYLYTGTYEHQEHHGIKHHGMVSLPCSVLRQGPVNELMKLAASPLSPFQKLPVVLQWKKCADAVTAQPTVLGVPLPKGVVYLDPPGIALDSTWQAAIAHKLRDLPDRDTCTPAQLFQAAKDSALATSIAWLTLLDESMRGSDMEQFWARVKSKKTGLNDEQFEQYHRFPYQFLSAGPYPPPAHEQADEWYLRVRVRTADEVGAGTDAPIILRAVGGTEAFPLDYAKDRNALLAYDDHEAGDDIAYVVGPFSGLPKAVTVTNHAADAGDVLVALGEMFVEAAKNAIAAVGDFLMSLVGGHADLVGVTKKVFSPAQLAEVGPAKQKWLVKVHGGNEGTYGIHGWIRRVGEGKTAELGEYAEYQVGIDQLHCKYESTPRPNEGDSDEPFLLALLDSPAQQSVQARRSKAFDDVDDDEWRHVGITFDPVKVPKGSAPLLLPLAVWESDLESAAARDDLLKKFAGKVEEKTASKGKEFLDTLGAAIASDWKVEHVDIYAFNRAFKGEAGTVWSGKVDAWLPAGGTWEFALKQRPLRHVWDLPASKGKVPDGVWKAILKMKAADGKAASMKVLSGAKAAKILDSVRQPVLRGGGLDGSARVAPQRSRRGGRAPVPK